MPRKKAKKKPEENKTKSKNIDWGFYKERLRKDCHDFYNWFRKRWKKSRNFKIGVVGTGLCGILATLLCFGNSGEYNLSFLENNDVYVVRDDGSGRRNITNSPNVSKNGVSWSDDGQQLIFNTNLSTFNIISRNGDKLNEITPSKYTNVYPVFSPDGRRIAFLNHLERYVYTMAIDGSDLRRVGGLCQDDPIRWVDNECLAFKRLSGEMSQGMRTGTRVAVCRFDGSRERVLSKLPGLDESRPGYNSPVKFYSLSKDGQKIIMQVHDDLYAGSIDGRVEILEGVQAGFTAPMLSPDGTEIVFSKSGSIYTVPFLGSRPCKLTERRNDCDPVYSPDSRKIAFLRENDIWVMDRDGSHQRNVTNTPDVSEGLISWVK